MNLKTVLSRAFRYIIKGVPINKVQANIVELSPNQLLEGRTALITGGTSGIGYEIAKAFLKAGANVIITGRDYSRIIKACDSLKESTERNCVDGLVLDNLEVSSFSNKIIEAVNKFGALDILVNNAGILTYDTISTESQEKYDLVMETNLRGPFFLSQHFGNYMIKNDIHGNILNIGSSSCLRPATSAYTISKWGLRGLTLGLARVLAPHGITVNGIAPGQTLTSMVPGHSKIDNMYRPNIPLGRWIKPEEIANMALILVSEMGRSIIGDIVYMTGGAAITTYEDITYNF